MRFPNDPPNRNSLPVPLSRREFVKLVGGMAAGLAVASCTPRPAPSPTAETAPAVPTTVLSPSAPVEVRYWGNPIPEYGGSRLQERIALFEAEHPGIRVIYEPYPEDGHTKFLAQAVAGNAPDIIENGSGNYRRLYQAGVALDLRPFMSDLPQQLLSEWPQTFMDWLTAPDGAVYGLPLRTWHMALIYNKDLFDQVGVTYPDESWTHDDYMEAMNRFLLEENGVKTRWGGHEIVKSLSWLENKLRAFDSTLVDPQNDSRCALGEEHAQEALRWIYDAIWTNNAWPQTAQIQDYWFAPFDTGALATMASGSWIISILDGSIGDRFRWDFAPYPRGPRGTRASFSSSDCWTAYAGTSHPEATWEVLKWLVSDEMETHMMESAGSEPSRASLYPRWKDIVRTRFPNLAEANLDAFEEPLTGNYAFFEGLFREQAAAEEILNPALEGFIDSGTILPEDFISIAEEVNQALAG